MLGGAHQNCDITELIAAVAHQRRDFRGNVAGFVRFIIHAQNRNRRTRTDCRAQGLFVTLGVIANHLIGGIDDFFGGAVVNAQMYLASSGEILFKTENLRDIRPAPTVNRLVIITHHAQITMAAHNGMHDAVLRAIRILVFIDHDILVALFKLFTNIFMLGE